MRISEQCQVSEVLVLLCRIQALAGVCGHGRGSVFYTPVPCTFCRACGYGAFLCWDRPVRKQEIPALKCIFLEAVEANALCTALTQSLM